MESDIKNILLQANKAVTKGDNEAFLSFCTEDVVWEFVGEQTLTGKEAVRAYIKEAYKQPPVFNVETLIAEGNWVTAMGKISLANNRGKTVNYAYCDVWRFRDGRMAALKAFVVEI